MIDYTKLPYQWGYVAGAASSDGSISVYRDKHFRLSLQVTNVDFTEHFTDCIEDIIQFRPKSSLCGNIYSTSVFRDDFIKTLMSWKSGIGTYEWDVPNIAFDNHEFGRGFINGYFDGDGSVSICNRPHGTFAFIRFSSVNLNALERVRLLIGTFDVGSKMYHDLKWNSHHIGITNNKSVLNYWNNIGIAPGYKQSRFLEYLPTLQAKTKLSV